MFPAAFDYSAPTTQPRRREHDRAMQSVSPILIAACAQKEQSGSFS